MKITLRKALKLRKALEAAVAKVDLPVHVEVSVLVQANRENPLAAVSEGSRTLAEAVVRHAHLSRILRDLRQAVDQRNVEATVSGLLAEAAHLDRLIALDKAVADAPVTPVEEQVKAEIGLVHDALRATDRPRGYGEPPRAVVVTVVTPAMRDAARRNLADLRRRREAVEDERVAANAGRHVEIAEDDAGILRDAGLV